MINLENYPAFAKDLNLPNSEIYPIVIINPNIDHWEDDQDHKDYIAFSMRDESLLYADGKIHKINFYDAGLKLSSIRQKLNITTKKFNITDVSINLNNFEIFFRKSNPSTGNYESNALEVISSDDPITEEQIESGEFEPEDILLDYISTLSVKSRISDAIGSFFQKPIRIYYKSQSCRYLNECIPVYTGVIKDYTYDIKKIKISLEDITSDKLDVDFPIANLGFGENIFSEKYRNKYIPACYGAVDKAPTVLYKQTPTSQKIYFLPDDIHGSLDDEGYRRIQISGYGNIYETEPEHNITLGNTVGSLDLSIYKGNYFKVLSEIRNDIDDLEFENTTQLLLDGDNGIYTQKSFLLDWPLNPPAANQLQCVRAVIPNETRLQLPSVIGENEGNYNIRLHDTTAYFLENSIDNPLSRNKFSLKNNYKDSYALLPAPAENFDIPVEDEFTVALSELIPHSGCGFFGNGQTASNGVHMKKDFASQISNWGQAMAAGIEGAEIIRRPSISDIVQKLDDKGYFIFGTSVDVEEDKHRYLPQFQMTEELHTEYWEYNGNKHLDFTGTDGLNPTFGNWEEGEAYYELFRDTDGSGNNWVTNNDNILYEISYPAPILAFKYDTNTWIYIGQYSSLALSGTTDWENSSIHGNIIWFDLFEDENSEKPFLFSLNDCARFKPTSTDAYWQPFPSSTSNTNYPVGSDSAVLYSKHTSASYNGQDNGIYDPPNSGHLLTANAGFSEVDPYFFIPQNLITQGHFACMNHFFILFKDGVSQGQVLKNWLNVDPWVFPENNNMTIKPFTLLPTMHRTFGFRQTYDYIELNGEIIDAWFTYYYISSIQSLGPNNTFNEEASNTEVGQTGNYTLGYEINNDSRYISLTSGDSTYQKGDTLMISYNFPDLSADDSISSKTYILGKHEYRLNPTETDNEMSDLNASNFFNVLVSATDVSGEQSSFDNQSTDFTTNLFSIDGTQLDEGFQDLEISQLQIAY